MKDYSKYYTPPKIAKELVQFLDIKDGSTAIDICCGTCNLLYAAYSNNPSLKCYGIDITDVDISWCKTRKSDGRKYSIATKQRFDIALANPPFGNIKDNSYASQLYVGRYSDLKSNRIEIEMLISNIKLLKKDGILLIIMPITFVNGISYNKIRQIISKHHFIKSIIELPSNAFYPEKINCCAIVIKKEKNTKNEPCTFYSMNSNFVVKTKNIIEYSRILNGCWEYDYTNTQNDFLITRGKISSNMFVETGIPVLHTSKKRENWFPSERYICIINKAKKQIVAEKGDLLISRIGNSAGYMCVYNGPPKYISDCLMLIKSPNNIMIKRLQDMDLRSLVKGVSTPHLTATDIYNLYNRTYKDL